MTEEQKNILNEMWEIVDKATENYPSRFVDMDEVIGQLSRLFAKLLVTEDG
jgi:hypothetical protein